MGIQRIQNPSNYIYILQYFWLFVKMINSLHQKIVSIKIVEETQHLYKDDALEYEVSTVRGIIFMLEDGREISFEKDIWFSEFIEVRTGYELETTFTSPNVFIEEWSDSNYIPDIERNIVVIL